MYLPGVHPNGVPLTRCAAELPLLEVTGEARLVVVPDTAEIRLGVSTRAEQASGAYQQAAAAINQVVRALLAAGLAQSQIQTSQIALQPLYEKERLIGYEGTATVRVTLPDLSAAGQVIDRAVAAGATSIGGIPFSVRDPGAHETRALTLAGTQELIRRVRVAYLIRQA